MGFPYAVLFALFFSFFFLAADDLRFVTSLQQTIFKRLNVNKIK